MTRKYIFNLDALEPGDILLSATAGKTSKIIQKYTAGSYSHAMLYVGNSIIHAVPSGIYSKNPQRLLFSNPSEMRALRAKDGISNKVAKKIVLEARYLAGGIYSVSEAIATKYHSNKNTLPKNRHQFCSRLVAQCYEKAGIYIVKNPNYCSPNDINRSASLVEVFNFRREASYAELALENTEDPNILLQEMTFDWLSKTRCLAASVHAKKIYTIKDVTEFLAYHRELDDRVSGFIIDSGYLDYFTYDRMANQYRYDIDLFLAALGSDSTTVLLINQEEKINNIDQKRFLINLKIAELNYKNLALKYTQLHIELYKNLLEEVRTRTAMLREVKHHLSI